MNHKRISKLEFYRGGGLSNPRLFRKAKGGAWTHWRDQS